MGVSRPDMTLTTQEAGGKDRITPEQQRGIKIGDSPPGVNPTGEGQGAVCLKA
jgi:hypothetical protein